MVQFNEKILIAVAALCIALGVVLYAPAGVVASTNVVKIISTLHLDSPLNETPEPSPGYYKFLDQCAKKMNDECGREIFVGMFYAEPLTKPCCIRLVAMGRKCHDALVQRLLETPQFKPIASMAFHKSVKIWDVCNSIAESPYSLF